MTLYVAATPIGNLEDITLRCLRVLKEVRAIYCEDTRRTRILLSHYDIHTPCLRYNEHNPKDMERILERLHCGETLAITSDNGMPVISDPGWRIISRARQAGLEVCVLPGPCAVVTAVAGSGLPGDSFVFLGFLPRSDSKRRRALEAAAQLHKTVVLYEAPTRVLDLIHTAREVFGPTAQASISRELTKIHEEWMTGTLEELAVKLGNSVPRGEFVVAIHPKRESPHGQDL